MNKQVTLTYYNTDPSEANTGMKHVLWEVTNAEKVTSYDWGFADWLGKWWDMIELPEGYTAKVVWWSNTLNPDVLTTNIIKFSNS